MYWILHHLLFPFLWKKKTAEIISLHNSQLEKRFSTPVKEIIDASQLDPVFPIKQSDSVASLIQGYFRQGIHRVPVLDNNGNFFGIVTQSDAVKLLFTPEIDWLTKKTIGQLTHSEDRSPVVSVTEKEKVVISFSRMLQYELSAVAVVHSFDGKIVGNISASDLKGLTPNHFHKLDLPVEKMFPNMVMPITCKEDDTLHNMLQKIVNNRIHRFYVVDNQNRPLYVVTLSTILRILARSFPPKISM